MKRLTGPIPKAYFAALREKIKWETLLQKFGITPTRRAKNGFYVRCVFHREKTPSLYFDNRCGFFHCFGCLASGDIFKFVQEVERCSPMDTIWFFERHFSISPEQFKSEIKK